MYVVLSIVYEGVFFSTEYSVVCFNELRGTASPTYLKGSSNTLTETMSYPRLHSEKHKFIFSTSPCIFAFLIKLLSWRTPKKSNTTLIAAVAFVLGADKPAPGARLQQQLLRLALRQRLLGAVLHARVAHGALQDLAHGGGMQGAPDSL